MFLLPFLLACGPDAPDTPNLTDRLDSDEVRAGVVESPEALFGGISAEGRVGDIKMYNDRSRWILQGLRDGSFYIAQGGTPIDADAVRSEGQPGRDIVDEWGGMFGLGRLQYPHTIEVISNGVDDGIAHVRVSGGEAPMEFLTGAIESDIVLDKGLEIVSDYRLEPGSPLLEVTTQITATKESVSLSVGDILMGSLEASDLWVPGPGLLYKDAETWPWAGYAGRRNDIAAGIFSASVNNELNASGGAELLLELATLAIAMNETIEIPQGEQYSFHRYYGVGNDLAELSDAWLKKLGVATETVSGQVEAPDGPVGGARVTILVDEAPFTLAFTDSKGQFQAEVPVGSEVRFLAEGMGPGAHVDLPDGYAPYSPYAEEVVKASTLDSIQGGASAPLLAQGRGVADEGNPLWLDEPAEMVIRSSDGRPFSARLNDLEDRERPDGRLVIDRLSDWGEGAWSTDGEIRFSAHPGRYELLVHRGLRWEAVSQEVVLTAGETLEVDVDLTEAYELDSWLVADPHTHASPSADGSIPMTDRLIVAAGNGVQIHFGTDHDHIADYRPLLAPIGIQEHLASIVSDEVSPLLRGHRNVFPVEPDSAAPNGGAWPWWSARVQSTEEGFAYLREAHPNALLQLNHPTSNGLAEAANWSPGKIGLGDRWTENFDLIEVLNNFRYEPYFEFFADLTNRGVLATPTGVSDSHGYFSGSPGLNVTFLEVGHSNPEALTPEEVSEALKKGRVVLSMGPFLEANPSPGSTIEGPTTLKISVHAPSWIKVSRLRLLKNGEEEAVILLEDLGERFPELQPPHQFELNPDEDAWYVVMAEGDESMLPVKNRQPWAMTGPIRIDVDGDGWEPPLPPLTVSP